MRSFLVLLSITLCMATLIYENIPKYHYATLFRQEVENIEKLKAIQTFTYPDHTEDITKIGQVTISHLSPQLNVINPAMMDFSIEEDFSFKLSFNRQENDFSCLLLTFDCMYHFNDKISFTASFNLMAKTYTLHKTYKQAEGKDYFIPTAEAEIVFELGEITINEKILPKAAFKELLTKYLTKIQADLVNRYNTIGVAQYYLEQSKIRTEVIHVNKVIASAENTISLNYDKTPSIEEKSIVMNINGKINAIEDTEDSLEMKSEEHFIAINKKLLQTIINENLFEYKFEENQKPIDDYSLNIESAGLICDELKSITDKSTVVIRQKIMSVTLDKPVFGQGTAVILTEVIDTKERETLLSFNTVLSVNFEMTIFQLGLNYRLVSSDIAIESITANPEPKRTITNEALLKEWFLTSLKITFAKEEYNLFKYAIDLHDYFSQITSSQVQGNHIIIQ